MEDKSEKMGTKEIILSVLVLNTTILVLINQYQSITPMIAK